MLQASKGARIRQGSPQEEAALAAHIRALAPGPAALAEAGQLAELLVLLQHEADARLLQAALADLVAAQAVRTSSPFLYSSVPLCMRVRFGTQMQAQGGNERILCGCFAPDAMCRSYPVADSKSR